MSEISAEKVCLVAGCEGEHYGKGYCKKHWRRWHDHGDPAVVLLRAKGTGTITEHGYIVHKEKDGRQYEHIIIAERVLGKPLPVGAQVHHFSGIGTDNGNSNLVICQDVSYHRLLHMRANALRACGHADWMKCCYCHQYDHPDNIYKRKDVRKGRSNYHQKCSAEYRRKRHALNSCGARGEG